MLKLKSSQSTIDNFQNIWYNVLALVLYAVEFSNYNGISTGLVHYPFSLSIILCKPEISSLANWTGYLIRQTRIKKNLNWSKTRRVESLHNLCKCIILSQTEKH